MPLKRVHLLGNMHYDSKRRAKKGFIYLTVSGLIVLTFISSRPALDKGEWLQMRNKFEVQNPVITSIQLSNPNENSPNTDPNENAPNTGSSTGPQPWRSNIQTEIAQEIQQCKERFNETLSDNLKVMDNYPRGVADVYMPTISGNHTVPDMILETPVFVTAFDNPYYNRAEGLFLNLHKVLYTDKRRPKRIIVIVYDLGLKSWQVQRVKKKCRCIIRKFPFEKYPAHVRDLKTYAFKPIIVQQVLMEFGFVWWMDTSVRLTTGFLQPAFHYATANSLLITVSTSNRHDFNIAKQTDTRTFKFLGEDPCKFRSFGESWATTLLFHFDNITKAVVSAWAKCALNRDCIAPLGTDKKIFCNTTQQFDGRCHRFDQSVISILLRRVYHDVNTYPLDTKLNDIYTIKRGYEPYYFEMK